MGTEEPDAPEGAAAELGGSARLSLVRAKPVAAGCGPPPLPGPMLV